MKNIIIALLILLLSIPAFSQNYKYEYPGRFTPSVKKEKLSGVQFISEITPELWRRLVLPDKERVELDRRRKRADEFQGYYIYSQETIDNKTIYYVVEYVSVEVSATCNGKIFSAQSASDKLTTKQKNILNTADLGTDINIKIKFKFKNLSLDKPYYDSNIIEGNLAVTVIPEVEAEYHGGFKQMSEYLMKNVFNKVPEKGASGKILKAFVKFTVNEEGKVLDAKIFRTSSDLKIDKILLDAIDKMPAWKPAENSKGIKVKQEFSISLGGGDGC